MIKSILLTILSMSFLMLSGCGSSKPSKSTETLSDQKYSTKILPKFLKEKINTNEWFYTALNPR